jgi:8-oxo-dGTP pyrophosphatase MutT (NUDIX family)
MAVAPKKFVGIILDAPEGLVLQRRDEKADIYAPGQTGLFGGEIEDGETPARAGRRELGEETSLDGQRLALQFVETHLFQALDRREQMVRKTVHVFRALIESADFEVFEGAGKVVIPRDVDLSALSLTPHTDTILSQYLASHPEHEN